MSILNYQKHTQLKSVVIDNASLVAKANFFIFNNKSFLMCHMLNAS